MATIRARLAAIGVAGALTVAGTVSALTPALAQETGETPTAEADTPTREERRAERRAAYATALAEELNLPAEQVQAAMEKVDEQFKADAKERRLAALKVRLDAAVADGRLTQEQADAIYAAAESGAAPFDRWRGRGPRGHRHPGGPAGGDAPAGDEASAEATSA